MVDPSPFSPGKMGCMMAVDGAPADDPNFVGVWKSKTGEIEIEDDEIRLSFNVREKYMNNKVFVCANCFS